MEMANCPRCRKVFPRLREPICDACVKEEEELFNKVKAFLEENPSSTVLKICDETGASQKNYPMGA